VVLQLIKGRLRGAKATGMAAAVLALAAGAGVSALAQEGHPIKGSWLGNWESNEVHGEFVLLVLDWDGEKISGTINPGTDNIEITNATLNPDGWVVEIDATDEDAQGGAVHYEIEGRIENLELPDRSIVGTWKSERGNGAFEVSRQ
jgi:hypothetical protein